MTSMLLKTLSPVDQSVVVEREETSTAQLDKVFSDSLAAHRAYRDTSLEERIGIATRFLDLLESNVDVLSREITLQMGRPLRYTPIEIRTAVARGRYMIKNARSALAETIIDSSTAEIDLKVKKVPLGVIYIIGAWNYPWLISINAVLPALLAGNSVVLKGSPQTPLCSERFVEFYAKAGLPTNTIQYIHVGSIERMQEVCQRKEIAHICFTGSVNGGRAVERASALADRESFINIGLELGGKDPAYVRADANIDHASVELVDGATFNSGQSCCAVERIYVHESVYDSFLRKYIEEVEKHVLGDPLEPSSTLGPVVSSAAAARIRQQITDALDKGAKAMLPTNPLDHEGTNYVTPQVLVDVDHHMLVMTEESFGPCVGIMKIYDDDEAIRHMNDSQFGLTASIWSTDSDAKVEQLMDRVDAGTVFLNRSDYPHPALAWTGVKLSGRGSTLGPHAYDQFYRLKSYHRKTVQ